MSNGGFPRSLAAAKTEGRRRFREKGFIEWRIRQDDRTPAIMKHKWRHRRIVFHQPGKSLVAQPPPIVRSLHPVRKVPNLWNEL